MEIGKREDKNGEKHKIWTISLFFQHHCWKHNHMLAIIGGAIIGGAVVGSAILGSAVVGSAIIGSAIKLSQAAPL